MPALVLPASTVHVSFRVAMAEFQAEGRGGPGDDSSLGNQIRETGSPAALFGRGTDRRAQIAKKL